MRRRERRAEQASRQDGGGRQARDEMKNETGDGTKNETRNETPIDDAPGQERIAEGN